MRKILTKEGDQKLLLLGNEAIVRGALEAGVGFASTYPGTPSSEIGDTYFKIFRDAGMYFEYSTNEKVALEIAAGAAHSGVHVQHEARGPERGRRCVHDASLHRDQGRVRHRLRWRP